MKHIRVTNRAKIEVKHGRYGDHELRQYQYLCRDKTAQGD